MWGYFLDNSGLNEIGENKNQLTDEIRSPNSVNNATVYANKIIDLLTDNSLFLRMNSNAKLNNKINDWKTEVESFEKKIYENTIHR